MFIDITSWAVTLEDVKDILQVGVVVLLDLLLEHLAEYYKYRLLLPCGSGQFFPVLAVDADSFDELVCELGDVHTS